MESSTTEFYEICGFKHGSGRARPQSVETLAEAKQILDSGGYSEGIIINTQTSEVIVHRGKSLKRFKNYLNREHSGWTEVKSFSSIPEIRDHRMDMR